MLNTNYASTLPYSKNNVSFGAALTHPERLKTFEELKKLSKSGLDTVCKGLEIDPENILLGGNLREFALELTKYCQFREMDTQLRDAVNSIKPNKIDTIA